MIYLGTTGWDFEHWRKNFYPDNLTTDKLTYYAKQSAFTELRSTYNRIPKKEKVLRWYNNSPDNFMFVAPMLRKVTYTSDLKIKEDKISEFIDAFEPLGEKLQMIMLHFPMKFQKRRETFDFIKELLDTVHAKFDGQILVEAPNRSWQKIEVKEELNSRSACLVGNDRRPIPSLMRDPEVYYLRLLGDKRTVPKSKFGEAPLDRDDDIKYWSEHIKFIDENSDAVFVAFDNHFSGNSTRDAYLMSKSLSKINAQSKGFNKR